VADSATATRSVGATSWIHVLAGISLMIVKDAADDRPGVGCPRIVIAF
jgi:hypothetical protein